MRWAERSRRAFVERPGHGIFGIVQGGVHPDLRLRSATRLVEIGFDGYAIGGLAIGEGQATTFAMSRRDGAGVAGGPAALSDGGRQARRPRRRGQARHRHVRLRPADPLGPHRPGLHPGRRAQSAQRPPCRRPGAARPGMPLPGLHRLQPRLSASSRRSGEILASMLLTEHNLHYYADLMAAMREPIAIGELGDFVRRFRQGAASQPRARRSNDRKARAYPRLGRPTQLPASPDEAVLETVPNPHPGHPLSRALHLPRIHLAVPGDRPARFRPFRHRLRAGGGDRREQVAEALSRLVPQSRRLSRGLHAGDRPSAGRRAQTALAAHRRLLVSARRHPDRRVLSDRRPPTGLWLPDHGVAPYRGRG